MEEEMEKYGNYSKDEECIIINIYSKCREECEYKKQPSICLNVITDCNETKEKICCGKKEDCCVVINVITKCKKCENPVEINVITDCE